MQIGKAKSLIFNISYTSWDKTLNSTSFVVKTYLVSKGMVALLDNKRPLLKVPILPYLEAYLSKKIFCWVWQLTKQ